MQLVAMVLIALLVLARTVQGCSYDCQKIPTQITLEECGNISINTTICAGQCYMRARVYEPKNNPPTGQEICNGKWTYEVAAIDGCPAGVTYPVATECGCTTCEESNTACYPKYSAMSSCPVQ